MEVSTVSQKTITGVDVYLTLEEACQLRDLLAKVPVTRSAVVYPLYLKLARALDEAQEANAQS